MSIGEKSALRLRMRRRLRALSSDEVRTASEGIARGLSAVLPDDALIGLFAGVRGEPQLLPSALHVAGAKWAWPRCTGPGVMQFHMMAQVPVERGAFGIPEPSSDAPELVPQALDAVVVPGIAFTRDGFRLGQGGGFYDRYLARIRSDALVVGVCYSWQVVDALPTEAHDMTMTHVVTETKYWS